GASSRSCGAYCREPSARRRESTCNAAVSIRPSRCDVIVFAPLARYARFLFDNTMSARSSDCWQNHTMPPHLGAPHVVTVRSGLPKTTCGKASSRIAIASIHWQTISADGGHMSAYAGDLTPQEAWDLLLSEPGAVLVDVRTEAEWRFVGVPDTSST